MQGAFATKKEGYNDIPSGRLRVALLAPGSNNKAPCAAMVAVFA